MNDKLYGQAPTHYGVASLIAMCLAFASWPLSVVIGFIMVYVAILLAMAAIVLGLIGIGSGIYHRKPIAIVTGALGMGLTCVGIGFIVHAVTHF